MNGEGDLTSPGEEGQHGNNPRGLNQYNNLTDQIVETAVNGVANTRPIPAWRTMGLTREERAKKVFVMKLRGMTHQEVADFFGMTKNGVIFDLKYVKKRVQDQMGGEKFKEEIAVECLQVAQHLRSTALSYVEKTPEDSMKRKGAIEVALNANEKIINLVLKPKTEIDLNVGGGVVFVPNTMTDEEWAAKYAPKDAMGKPVVRDEDDVG